MIEAPIPTPAINVDGVSHSFKHRRALRKVTFQVGTQSLHGFVGPNGAGKTTALKLICTLMRPNSGVIEVFGHDVRVDFRTVRRRVGFMPDHLSMYRQMTVFEYLDFFGAAYGLSVKQRDRVIDDILTLTDMETRKDDIINGLSRGMQQRVSLARVLINDPELLLLDEPAAGLDPRGRIELMEILQELRRMGKTIFISSHILSELADVCDSLTIIDRGRIKYSGPISHLLKNHHEHSTYRLALANGAPDIQEQLGELKGVIDAELVDGTWEYKLCFDPAQTDTNSLLQAIMGMGVSIASFSREQKHLNQAFMDLTTRGIE